MEETKEEEVTEWELDYQQMVQALHVKHLTAEAIAKEHKAEKIKVANDRIKTINGFLVLFGILLLVVACLGLWQLFVIW